MLKKVWNWLKKQNFSSDQLWTIAIASVLLGLIFLLFMIWWSRRKKRLAREGESMIPEFRKIWRNFLTHIPSEFRHSISMFQHFVALGEAGSGKSMLIDLYTDWQGQARQFYPSYASDPDLQIYLGSQVVVQELPAPVLNNIEPKLRVKLLKHWGKLYKNQSPILVVTVQGNTLNNLSPDSIKQQAQLLRGKANVLSQILKRSVETRVVLTHMDEVPGFTEFTRFLRQYSIPFTIPLKSVNNVEGLEDSLEKYESHLNRALVSVPGQDYMSIMSFMQNGPEILARAAEFIAVLTERDPLSYEPAVTELYLSSSSTQRETTNPYHLNEDSLVLDETKRPNFKHRLFCLTVSLLAMAFFGTQFVQQRNYWSRAKLVNQSYHSFHRPNAKNQNLDDDLVAFNQTNERFGVYEFLNFEDGMFEPNFYPSKERDRFRAEFVRTIREAYLLPKLQIIATTSPNPERSLYVLGLLYASKNNELGDKILADLVYWSKNVEMPVEILEHYVEFSEDTWQGTPNNLNLVLDKIPVVKKDEVLETWLIYLQDLQQKCGANERDDPRQIMLKTSLQVLQARTEKLREKFERTLRWHLALEICQNPVLQRKPIIARKYQQLNDKFPLGKWLDSNQKNIRYLFDMIKAADVDDYPSAVGVELRELEQSIKAMRSLNIDREKIVTLQPQSDPFSFSTVRWRRLILRSRILNFLNAFLQASLQDPHGVFFGSRTNFPDIVINVTNNGTFVYEGNPRIDGRFTRLAYEKQVLSVVDSLPKFIQNLSDLIDKETLDRIRNRVSQQINQYAQDYYNAYLRFYLSFGIDARSTPGLVLTLQQLQLPVSPFIEFLQVIRDNTELGEKIPPILKPLAQKLERFRPVSKLLEQPKDKLPEIQNYKALIAQMEGIIKGEEGAGAEEKEEKEEEKKGEGGDLTEEDVKEFKDQLSKTGTLALSILKRERDSYLTVTKRFLNSVGIKKEMQKPFLEIIYQVYLIGLQDIETNIATNWTDKVFPVVAEYLLLYPFDKTENTDVPPLEWTDVMRPRGTFWVSYYRLVAPVLIRRKGLWASPRPLIRPIRLPRDMVRRVNWLEVIRKAMWKDNGDPKPLDFTIQPPVLAPSDFDRPYATLAYLSAGENSVIGFNQKPAWYNLKVAWWKRDTSEAGVQLINRDDRVRTYLTARAANELWSFFRLLDEGEENERNILTWKVTFKGRKSHKVDFRFSSDPRRLFRFDRAEGGKK